jgi:hypothetical protein
VLALAGTHRETHPELWRRVQTHARFVASSEGHRSLAGGLTRLDLVIGEAWRSVLTPRPDPTGQPVGVSLTHAITERAVVLWRTHVDLMPDEAQTITALILTDIQASAVEAQPKVQHDGRACSTSLAPSSPALRIRPSRCYNAGALTTARCSSSRNR